MITSCSDDDSSSNNNNNSDAVLLKKMVETYEDGTSFTTTYTYDEDKLVRKNESDGYRTEYFYTNNKLSGIKSYDDTNHLTGEDVLTYDNNGRLATRVEYWYALEEGDEEWAEKSVFTYNSNGTISRTIYIGDMDSQTELWEEGTITIANGNMTKLVSEGDTAVNTYDSKNNPMKNTFAQDIFTLLDGIYGGKNNLLTYTQTGADPESITRTYTYNSDDYPTTAVETNLTDGSNDQTNIQYFYE
ncbi:hypothetical protein OGH69_11145 [Flavobacterium sp. MFBS3-15]|uniref:hypothetical protein n=1 Tax=Flavobacterium sp. MFBS3-15 TaxID=2989816 RepID=UPI0022366DB6|nr:hypothetical protein [Flavobacterium sp. MFBS3-15]MCW4469524.1 hypothetical protein [Flavobacterium sp. MFBS3-15]